MSESLQLAVIGAGPAGLAAAVVAAKAGVEVAVFEEQHGPGGQIFRSVETIPEERARLLGADYQRGRELVRDFRASGAGYFPGTQVWSINREREIGLLYEGVARMLRPERILLAGGAMERPVPFPGWTLPGVMNAGAGQILMKSAGLVPEEAVVLAGTGPLLLLLAWQYQRAGVDIRAVLDVTAAGNTLRALPHLPAALLARHYLTRGLGYKRDLWRSGIRIRHQVSGLQAEGQERLTAVTCRIAGIRKTLETGLLLTHFGVIPNTQLSLAAGCRHVWDDSQLCWRPQADAWGNTSVPGIAVAGDCAAIGGARAAEHAGRLAALEALRAIGHIDARKRDQLARQDRDWLVADLRIRPFLEALYRPPSQLLRVPDDRTLVCRCEEVTAGDIRQAVRDGHSGINPVKFITRCGMGPCQGRQCGAAAAHIIADALNRPIAEVGQFQVRPPVKPVSLGQLAALEGTESGP